MLTPEGRRYCQAEFEPSGSRSSTDGVSGHGGTTVHER